MFKRHKPPITMGKFPMHINSGEIKSSNQSNQHELSIMPNQLKN